MTANRRPMLVIYHGGCPDGFTAAWVVHKVYPEAEFYPGVYGQAPPDVAGRDVILVDFSSASPMFIRPSQAAKLWGAAITQAETSFDAGAPPAASTPPLSNHTCATSPRPRSA